MDQHQPEEWTWGDFFIHRVCIIVCSSHIAMKSFVETMQTRFALASDDKHLAA